MPLPERRMAEPPLEGRPARASGPKVGLWIAGAGVLLVVGLFALARTPAPPAPGAGAGGPGGGGSTAAGSPGTSGRPSAPAPASPAGTSAAPAGSTAPGPGAAPAIPAPPAGGAPRQGGVAQRTVDPPPAAVNPAELPPDHPPVSAPAGSQASIQWLGLSCFYIHSPGGVAVVTDPFDARGTGLAAPSTGAHLVTVSTDSPRHGHVHVVRAFMDSRKQVVRGTPASLGDVRITPVPAGGGNTAYLIEAGDLRIAHLGDLKQPPSAEQLRALGAVDILMIPVGGDGLSPKQAVAVAQQVKPRIILPMEYATREMEEAGARLRPVDDFVSAGPWPVTAKDADIMLLSRAELPPDTEIYTLKYGR